MQQFCLQFIAWLMGHEHVLHELHSTRQFRVSGCRLEDVAVIDSSGGVCQAEGDEDILAVAAGE